MSTIITSRQFQSREERIQTLIKQEMAIGARKSWGINGTSLKNYAFTPGRFQPNRKDTAPEQLDFEALFVREAEKVFSRGEKLNVLDIGTGDGTTWRKPILKYGEKFNLSATTLCDCHGIWEGIRPMLKFTNAARVHLHYPAESFDVVLSHYGLHMELRAAFDGIIALLKKGGQAFLSGYGYAKPWHPEMDDYHSYLSVTRGEVGSNFKIIMACDTGRSYKSSAEWFLWLQKT